MKLALHFANFNLSGGPAAIGPHLAAAARAADEGGFAAMTLMDHYFQLEMNGKAEDPMLEGYTSLGFLAGQTNQLKLGLLVTGVTYRHPGLLAKIVTTLDVLSNGRAMLGIGAAWYEREHLALGVPYPPTAERFKRLEETLQIVRQMWSDNDGPFTGKHYQLAETLCVPRPIQQPGPPILIGGMGEQKTLRFVAKYADACNLFAVEPAELAHKFDVLAQHCAEAGRDIKTIQRTIVTGVNPLDDVDGFLGSMEEYAKLGIDQVWISPKQSDPAAWTTQVAEQVVPRLSQI